jgi:hypothetical protein
MLQLGDLTGLEDVKEGLRIQLDRNDTARAMSTYNNLATVQIARGELEVGRKTIEEAIAYGTVRGLPNHVDWSRSTRNEALFPLGEWDECLHVAEELVAEDAKRGGSQVGIFGNWFAAMIRFFRGETETPLTMLEQVLSSARAIEDPQVLLPSLTGLLSCYDLVGRDAEAKALAEDIQRIAPQHPVFLAGSFGFVAPALRHLKMDEELEALLAAAKALGPAATADVDFGRANLAESRGELTAAAGLLASVIAANDEMSNRFGGAGARIEAARLAGLESDDETKIRLLEEAESLAKAMKANRLLDQIARLRGDGRVAVTAGSSV